MGGSSPGSSFSEDDRESASLHPIRAVLSRNSRNYNRRFDIICLPASPPEPIAHTRQKRHFPE